MATTITDRPARGGADRPTDPVAEEELGGRPTGQQTRLLIANPWFYPVLAGPAERFRRYTPGLNQRGVQVSVVTAKPDGQADEEVNNGVHITRIAAASGSRFKEKTVAYRALRRLFGRRRPGVFQVFSSSPWNVPLVWALRLRGVPSVYVATMVAEGSGTGRFGILRKVFRRWVLSGYSKIVTSSQVMTDILQAEAGGGPKRFATIGNGVDLERFKAVPAAEKAALRERLGIGKAPAVLFVGGIYPRKAIHTLLEGWAHVADGREAQLVVVGPKPDEEQYRDFHAKVDALAQAAPNPDRIQFTGGVGNVDDYMKACDLFVFPSEREGMPNVVPEAMAAGLPVILTAFKGLPTEFGRPGSEFVLVERTPEGLAEAINDLLDDGPRAEQLGRQGRRWVEENLDVELSLNAYARLYAGLANS
ncbi:MAG: glycosyltransferase family 4 protein [Longimicrobiales bacterium]